MSERFRHEVIAYNTSRKGFEYLMILYYMLIALLIVCSALFQTGVSKAESEQPDQTSEASFVRFLFTSEEYSIALLEARRLQFSSDNAVSFCVYGKLAACAHYFMKEYAMVTRILDGMESRCADDYHMVLMQDVILLRQRTGNGESMLAAFEAIPAVPRILVDRLAYELAWIDMEQYEWEPARRHFGMVQDESEVFPHIREMLDVMAQSETLPRRSPVTSACLSAVLPGAGHLYCGRPRDALTALLLNALFIWGATESFHKDENAAGIIIASLELGWYTGSIFSAINAAHRFNWRYDEQLVQSIRSIGMSPDDIDREYYERLYIGK